MFPKSLSDIDETIFAKFVNNLSADSFAKKLIVLSSIMAEGSAYDVERMKAIVAKISSSGYKLVKGNVEPTPFPKPKACCKYINATFPDEIKDFMGALRSQCESPKDECSECTVSRFPILRTDSARFQQLGFERE